MIIDAHQHFYTKEQYAAIFQAYGSPDILKPLLRDFTPSDLKPILDKFGIDKTVLIQIDNTLENTYELIDISNTYDWIGAVVGWVDLKDPRIGDVLKTLKENIRFKYIMAIELFLAVL